jgi:predicted nucleic acid-binding protein
MSDRRITALIDANVLIPATTGDVLATLAFVGGFTAALSPDVLNEVIRNQPKSASRIEALYEYFSSNIVHPLKHEIDRIPLEINRKDAHLVVAAQRSGADFIVTLDQDFAKEVASQNLGFICIDPWNFILLIEESNPTAILDLVKTLAFKRKKPKQWTQDEAWGLLAQIGGSQVEVLRRRSEAYERELAE